MYEELGKEGLEHILRDAIKVRDKYNLLKTDLGYNANFEEFKNGLYKLEELVKVMQSNILLYPNELTADLGGILEEIHNQVKRLKADNHSPSNSRYEILNDKRHILVYLQDLMNDIAEKLRWRWRKAEEKPEETPKKTTFTERFKKFWNRKLDW